MATFRKRAAIRQAILSLHPRRQDYYGLRRALMNFILEEVAHRHFKAFMAKQYGGRDEFRRRWPPLSDVTIAKKGHSRIGYQTGRMEASFRPGYVTREGRYVKGHQLQIAQATAYSIKFGTRSYVMRKGRRIPKATFFHGGTRRQPARPFWTPAEISKWVADGIVKGLPRVKRLMEALPG